MSDICAWLEETGVCAIMTVMDRDELIYCECGGYGCGVCPKYVKSVN